MVKGYWKRIMLARPGKAVAVVVVVVVAIADDDVTVD